MALLPTSTNHLTHPFYNSVFKPFKLVLKCCVSYFMLEGANSKITKKVAMTIGSKSCHDEMLVKNINIVSVFQSEVVWPLFFPMI